MIRFLYRLFLAVSLTAAVAVVALRLSAANRESIPAADLLLPDSQISETVHGALHFLRAGPEDGDPVLLIHGSVGWSGLWRPTISFLADQGYQVIAVDLPPMGLSQRDERMDFSRQAQALRILALVDELDIRPVIIAHSFGAGAAVEAMMTTPKAFAGGVLVAGALNLGENGQGQELPLPLQPKTIREAAISASVTNPYATKWLFRQFVFQKQTITDQVVETLEYPFLRRGTTAGLAAWLPTLLIPPVGAASTDPGRYADLTMPVALIWGREDKVTPPDQAEALRVALGDAPLFWLNNVGHIPQIEAPDAFHELLGAALERLQEN